MENSIRGATVADVRDIKKLLSFFCLETDIVEVNLPEFLVAVLDNKIVGCACLDIGDIVELRSIAVLPSYRNQRIGSKLMDSIIDRAKRTTDSIYLRTTSPVFFEKNGFHRMNDNMKMILWADCEECDKFHICRQVLMRINLSSHVP
jgi:amino-acid N-acetyltransferase